MKRQRTILYWSFVIDVLGPRYSKKKQRDAIRKALSRKRLTDIERAALKITKVKLPAGFTAAVS